MRFQRKAVFIILLFSLALLCWPADEAKAQANARYYMLLSDQNRNLGLYYIFLHWNLKTHGYSDTYGYDDIGVQYFQNAYSYAVQAAEYALQDYNNNVSSTYYQAYYEYFTLSTMQNYWSIGLYYITLSRQASDYATIYQYTQYAISYIYLAITNYGPAIFHAGCEPNS